MSYPYGRREKITLLWEDGYKKSRCRLVRGKWQFDGSRKHCAEQLVKWLCDKDFTSPPEIVWMVKDISFKPFGKYARETMERE